MYQSCLIYISHVSYISHIYHVLMNHLTSQPTGKSSDTWHHLSVMSHICQSCLLYISYVSGMFSWTKWQASLVTHDTIYQSCLLYVSYISVMSLIYLIYISVISYARGLARCLWLHTTVSHVSCTWVMSICDMLHDCIQQWVMSLIYQLCLCVYVVCNM
jgi:uncharacterized membrane protein (DUF485 family)